jgi:hypothetical protein
MTESRAIESKPIEHKSDDIAVSLHTFLCLIGSHFHSAICKYHCNKKTKQEFRIDLTPSREDNKTIIHHVHQVAARVVCVFNEQDVQVAPWAKQEPDQC